MGIEVLRSEQAANICQSHAHVNVEIQHSRDVLASALKLKSVAFYVGFGGVVLQLKILTCYVGFGGVV